jgi:quercetin 2,3-dioxygenase
MKLLSFIRRNAPRHWVGDGFPVRSVFSYNDTAQALSPFLLLDHAGPADFEPTTQRRGVGQHPHRGFETVTIVYAGEVEHRDSTGAGGMIGPGDVQWMTAASGILHEEYHGSDYARRGGPFEMLQLWVNLPARDKMAAPGYQELRAAQIPSVELPGEAGTLRVIAGEYAGASGPARTFSPINLWDLQVHGSHRVELQVPVGHTTALFVLKGAVRVPNGDGEQRVGEAELAVLERDGDTLAFDAIEDVSLLLLGGEPLNEPVIGHGPFVMNTEAEIRQAFADFQSGRLGRAVARAS